MAVPFPGVLLGAGAVLRCGTRNLAFCFLLLLLFVVVGGVGCGGALLGPEGTGCMWFLRGLRGGCVWCVFLVPLLSVCSYRVPGVLVGVGGCVGGVWLFFEMCIVDASIWFVVIVLVYSVLW